VLSGRLLDEVGVVAPVLEVDDLVIVHLVAERTAGEPRAPIG
jgi:alpha-galactosidase